MRSCVWLERDDRGVCYVFVECVVVFGLNDGMTAVCYVFCEMRRRSRIVKLV